MNKIQLTQKQEFFTIRPILIYLEKVSKQYRNLKVVALIVVELFTKIKIGIFLSTSELKIVKINLKWDLLQALNYAKHSSFNCCSIFSSNGVTTVYN